MDESLTSHLYVCFFCGGGVAVGGDVKPLVSLLALWWRSTHLGAPVSAGSGTIAFPESDSFTGDNNVLRGRFGLQIEKQAAEWNRHRWLRAFIWVISQFTKILHIYEELHAESAWVVTSRVASHYISRCVFSHKPVHQFDSPQVDSSQGAETRQKTIGGEISSGTWSLQVRFSRIWWPVKSNVHLWRHCGVCWPDVQWLSCSLRPCGSINVALCLWCI